MNERRAQGLCYFCDEPYTPKPGLSHKNIHIHVMGIYDQDTPIDNSLDEDSSSQLQIDPQISVHVLTGMANFKTMRVTGYHKKRPLHILVDSGSTHNFLDIQVAKKFGCKIEEIEPLHVVVADGNKLHISTIVRNFTWTIQHTTFESNIMLIPLGCCDLVLGIEWLVTLGDITWNFDKLSMEFKVQGRRHVLRGASSNAVKTIRRQQMSQTLANGVHLSML